MGDYKPKKGDRVRVVLEGEVYHVTEGRFGVSDDPSDGRGNIIYPDKGHAVSIEKIEPPVEVFGPGDVVRPRNESYRHLIYLLGANGYSFIDTAPGGHVFHKRDTARKFTSATYEKVDLG